MTRSSCATGDVMQSRAASCRNREVRSSSSLRPSVCGHGGSSMSRNRSRDSRPRARAARRPAATECGTPPANSIGTTVGNVTAPGEVTATSVTVAPKNLTQGKSSTLFGVFVQPEPGSSIAPRIVAVEQEQRSTTFPQAGPPLRRRPGFDGQAAAFVKVSQPGPLTILVTGQASFHRHLRGRHDLGWRRQRRRHGQPGRLAALCRRVRNRSRATPNYNAGGRLQSGRHRQPGRRQGVDGKHAAPDPEGPACSS